MRYLVALLFFCCVGCSPMQMAATTYSVEGVGYFSYDRAKRSNDVVLVKGLPGKPNRLYMRRGMNPLWGPSELLGESGVAWWDFVESNRRVQIYSDIAHAVYGKYPFVASPEAFIAWGEYRAGMYKKYPNLVDFAMYEHLLRKEASLQETASELKQEKKMFAQRNKPIVAKITPDGVSHDLFSREVLRAIGFIYEKK